MAVGCVLKGVAVLGLVAYVARMPSPEMPRAGHDAEELPQQLPEDGAWPMHPFCRVGASVTVQLCGGQTHAGRIVRCAARWLELHGQSGPVLVRVAQVAAVLPGAPLLPDDETERMGRGEQSASTSLRALDQPQALHQPRVLERPSRSGARLPARPWTDADLRALAAAFLDQARDGELAMQLHRTRTQITILRQAFEAARGNLAEDTVSPVAQSWIPRLRRVLAG